MARMITISEEKLIQLLSYTNSLFDFIDTNDFEEENVSFVKNGYEANVSPMWKALENNKAEPEIVYALHKYYYNEKNQLIDMHFEGVFKNEEEAKNVARNLQTEADKDAEKLGADMCKFTVVPTMIQ